MVGGAEKTGLSAASPTTVKGEEEQGINGKGEQIL